MSAAPPAKSARPAPTAAKQPDKWAGNRHRFYMQGDLKELCELACAEGRISLSTLLQRAARRYVRSRAADLRRRLAALPAPEQARLREALDLLFTK